jgi:TctA family transporter
MVLGLIASVVIASGSPVKAIGMVIVGLLLGLVGTDIFTGAFRLTFGWGELADGIDFVVVAMGLFGVGEVIRNLDDDRTRDTLTQKVHSLWPTRADFRSMAKPILRGSALGCLLGLIPGGGALLASFGAYALEKKLAKDPSRFGKGAIEGVAGAESANNAGAQTSFIPMLTLGIPSNAIMGLMIGAIIMQGIQPGPGMMAEQPRLFWGLVASMWIGNLFLIVLNLPLIGLWSYVLRVPYNLLYPAILVFCCIGVFSLSNSIWQVYIMCLFGLGGYLFVKLGCEPAPLLLGFILGPLMEENLRRAMQLSRGDPMIFLERPVSVGVLIVALLTLVAVLVPAFRKTREKAFQES